MKDLRLKVFRLYSEIPVICIQTYFCLSYYEKLNTGDKEEEKYKTNTQLLF